MIDYCPCGNNKVYEECCKPFIDKKKLAETAEELMRSRYTAFTKGKVDYILNTHQKKTRPLKERTKMQKWMNSVEWLGLSIVKTENGFIDDDHGLVEYRAIFIEDGYTEAIHEKSIFVKENGKWFYVSGTHLQNDKTHLKY